LLSSDGKAIGQIDQGDDIPKASGLGHVMISEVCETSEGEFRLRGVFADSKDGSGSRVRGSPRP